MFKSFKSFLMRGDFVTAAVALIIALAFSTLIKAFTDFVVNPVATRFQGGSSVGLGWQLGKSGNQANPGGGLPAGRQPGTGLRSHDA